MPVVAAVMVAVVESLASARLLACPHLLAYFAPRSSFPLSQEVYKQQEEERRFEEKLERDRTDLRRRANKKKALSPAAKGGQPQGFDTSPKSNRSSTPMPVVLDLF